MAAIAAFAKSEPGQDYAAICRYWGVDPASGVRSDVVAMNLRAALMAVSEMGVPVSSPTEPEGMLAAAAAENERLWLQGV